VPVWLLARWLSGIKEAVDSLSPQILCLRILQLSFPMGDEVNFVEGPWTLLDEDVLDFPVPLGMEWTGSFNANYGVSQWDESLTVNPAELLIPPQFSSFPGSYQPYVSPDASAGLDMPFSDPFLDSQDALGHVFEQFRVDVLAHTCPV
jgi:hypothetical protein